MSGNPLNTLAARITAGEGVLIAALVVVAAAGVAALQDIRQTVGQELQVHARVAVTATETVAYFAQQIQAAEQLLGAPDSAARTAFRSSGRRAHAARDDVLLLTDLSTQDRLRLVRASDLHRRAEAWFGYAHRLVESGLGGEAAAAATARTLAASLIDLQRDIASETANRSQLSVAMVVTAARQREQTIWLVLILSTIAGAAIVVLTIRSIRMPLAWLVNVANRFSRGDLRPVTMAAMPRELSDVAEALSLVGARQRAIVAEVREQSDRVVAAAGDLSAMSEQLAASGATIAESIIDISTGARRQVEALERGQTATHRLRRESQGAVEVANRVAAEGSRIHELAERHGEHVNAAGNALLDIGTVVHRSARQVEDLDRLSAAIDEFVDLIKEVSSETNLLAVNAAIEAARAPVGGEGFAVVADEVRQLADSSGGAADDAAKSIAVVRQQIAQVGNTMEIGRTRVEGVETVAQGAADALSKIVELVTDMEQAARGAMLSAKANVETVDNISQLMREAAEAAVAHAESSESVSAAAEEQGASTEEIAAQAADLNRSAERLKGLIRDLRV